MKIVLLLLEVLLAFVVLLAIFLIAWFIYAVFWKAYFVPIDMKITRDERISKAEKEFNKIEVKIDRMKDELDIIRNQYAEAAVKKNDIEVDIQRKQKLYKEYDDEIKAFRKWKESGKHKDVVSADEPSIKKDALVEIVEAKIDVDTEEKPKVKEVTKKRK